MRSGAVAAAVLDLLLILAATAPFCFGANVTYDHRGLIIGGRRRVLISGSIHYMRSTPEVSISEFFTHTHTEVSMFVSRKQKKHSSVFQFTAKLI